MEPSKIRQQLGSLKKERDCLEYKLFRPYRMAPYSLVSLVNICGKPNCRCKKGKPHGPYWYLSAKEEGKTKMIYLSKEDMAAIAPLVHRYKEYQTSLTKIRNLNQQILGLLKEIEKSALVPPSRLNLKKKRQRKEEKRKRGGRR